MTRNCPHEDDVQRGAARESLDAELRRHAAECPICRETLRAGSFLRQAAAAEHPPRLPTASQVFWRAQILERLFEPPPELEAAARPARWGLGFAFATLSLAFLFAVRFQMRSLESLTDVLGVANLPGASLLLTVLFLAPIAVSAGLVWSLRGD